MVSQLLGLGSAIIGAVRSASLNNKARQLISQQREDNKDWYNAKSAEDYTQRTDAQNVINRQRDLLEERYKNARATNIVGGGSDEALAMQQAAANDAMAQTMSNIASEASDYKSNLEREYRAKDDALNQQQAQSYQQQAQSTAAAAGQAVNAALSLGGNALASQTGGNTGAAISSNPTATAQDNLNNTIKQQALSTPIKKISL